MVVRQPSSIPPVQADLTTFADSAAKISARPADTIVFADVERASSYRYGERAFLIQLVIDGLDPMLIDPESTGQDIGELSSALSARPMCLHACRADLPSLHALGVEPTHLHDTEIAAKVLSTTGFSLGWLVESYLGVHLAKEYSRADWSRRPLPAQWLEYALGDVLYMPELLSMLLEDTETVPISIPDHYPRSLAHESRAEWYDAAMSQMEVWSPAPPPDEPWRKLSKLSSLRSTREYARARALWEVREEVAFRNDVSVHRIVRDRSIIQAARTDARSFDAFEKIGGFADSDVDGVIPTFAAAIKEADAIPPKKLPAKRAARDDTQERPSHRQWKVKAPGANALLSQAREELTELSEVAQIEMQTLLPSTMLREWVWAEAGTNVRGRRGKDPVDVIESALAGAGAAPCQIRLVTPALLAARDATA